MKTLWSRLKSLFRARRLDTELESEIALHLTMLEQEYRARGMSAEEARLAGRREFGGVTQIKEVYRERRGVFFLETLWQDLCLGIRTASRSRGFAAAVVLTLLLGIGANTAVFSVIYSVLLKPLPYRDPDRLVWISEYIKAFKGEVVSGPDFADWRRLSRSFDSMAAFMAVDQTLTGAGEPADIRTVFSSEILGRLLGVTPALGRDFSPEEMLPAGSRVIIISHDLHQKRFGGDPAAVGKTVDVNNGAHTIIGVLPRGFRLALPSPFAAQTEADAIASFPIDFSRQRRGGQMMIVQVLGRLKPGVAIETARAELNKIRADIAAQFPGGPPRELRMIPLVDRIVGGTRRSLLVLWAAVSMVLLIACVNVANLLLARSAARSRESAIRAALGAGRFRLIRQFLTESMILACGAGAAGVLLAYFAIGVMARRSPIDIPRLKDATLDWTVLAFTLAMCLAAGFFAGIIPAVNASRWSLSGVMKEGSSASGANRGRKLHSALVVAEVAGAFVLVIGAGLMLKSLWVMHSATAAFEPGRLVTARVELLNPQYGQPAQKNELVSQMMTQIAAIPNVRAAAAWSGRSRGPIRIGGLPEPPPGEATAEYFRVTPQFFAAAGMRLLAGRTFGEDDQLTAQRTAIVNETLVRRFFPQFPKESPIGRTTNIEGPQNQAIIVGVVADFRERPDADPDPQIFVPHMQNPFRVAVNLMVRSGADPMSLVPGIRNIVQRVPRINLIEPQTLEERLSVAIAPRRFQATLLVAFAGVALLLALVGVYGVLSYSVTQRTHEIGVRMAIGARESDVFKIVLLHGLKLVGAGAVVGLVGAFSATRFIATLLFGVKPTDGWTFIVVSIGFLGAAALAAYVPARRAVHVDPVVALRHE